MPRYFYRDVEGNNSGPVPLEDLLLLRRQGRVYGNTPVAEEPHGDLQPEWQTLADIVPGSKQSEEAGESRGNCLLIGGCISGALIAALVAIGVVLGLAATVFFFIGTLLKSSEPYQHALLAARSNTEVRAAIGTPIEEPWWFLGNYNINNTGVGSSGNADLTFDITGSKGETATVYVVATKAPGRPWTYHRLEARIPDSTVSTKTRLIALPHPKAPEPLSSQPDAEETPPTTQDNTQTDPEPAAHRHNQTPPSPRTQEGTEPESKADSAQSSPANESTSPDPSELSLQSSEQQ